MQSLVVNFATPLCHLLLRSQVFEHGVHLGPDVAPVLCTDLDETHAPAAYLHLGLPTGKNRVAGNILYGADANVGLPLMRNRGGREFELEAQIFEHQKRKAEATLDNEALVVCADAIERYIVRYATQEQLETYEELVKEKRRVWYQTAADYRKKMITPWVARNPYRPW